MSHPRTTARGKLGRRIGAAITAITFGGAFALAGAGTAYADEAPEGDHVSWAQAQFLSGSIAGSDLETVASVEPAEAWNDGSDPTMTDKDPLAVNALDSVQVGTGDSVQVTTDGVQAGALGQYASATADGQSFAAAGAVVDDGGVGVGDDVAMPGADATVDLSNALSGRFSDTLTNLSLTVNAIGAQAEADGANASGDYVLDGAVLHMSSPSISELTEKVNTALDSVDNEIDVLDGDNGALVADINELLQGINPALNLLGGDANVSASVDAGDLRSQVEDLLEAQYGESGVTFNLETGDVSIDLAAAQGGDLNDLPVGTELLSAPIIDEVLGSITGKVAHIADQVVEEVEGSLNDALVGLHIDLDQDVAQAPLVEKICETVQQVIQVPTQVLTQVTIQVPVIDGVVAQVVNGVPIVDDIPIVGSQVGTLLGGILGGGHTVTWITQTVDKYITQNVSKVVDQVVCDNKITPVAPLENSVDIDMTGTVDQFLDGEGVESTGDITLLGIVNHSLDLGLATDSIAGSLTDALFDNDGAISDLTAALDSGLVQPAVDGLLNGDNAVGLALTDVLSVMVNLQELIDGTFTQTALRVTALGGLDGVVGGGGGILGTARSATGLAQVNLAQASVGPNVLSVEDPCVGDCGVGGETVTPFGAPGSGGLLAMTGVSIALLVAIVLALLAAGAYLVREGYRNRHSAVAE
jgi:hypothetical protein